MNIKTEQLVLYEELLKSGNVLPGLTDPVFKRIMTNHKDYLGLILEGINKSTEATLTWIGIRLILSFVSKILISLISLEFSNALKEMSYGKSLGEALESLKTRIPSSTHKKKNSR